MTGLVPPDFPPEFLQLQNSAATANLLEQLGITSPVRFNVSPIVVPVAILSVEDPTKVDKLAWGRAVQAAVAAQSTYLQIFNPATSGVSVHADSVILTIVAAASTIQIRQFDTPLTTDIPLEKQYRDRRLPGTPVAQLRTQTSAASLGDIVGSMDLLADEAFIIPLDVFLGPGQGVQLVIETVNLLGQSTWFWEERVERT